MIKTIAIKIVSSSIASWVKAKLLTTEAKWNIAREARRMGYKLCEECHPPVPMRAIQHPRCHRAWECTACGYAWGVVFEPTYVRMRDGQKIVHGHKKRFILINPGKRAAKPVPGWPKIAAIAF